MAGLAATTRLALMGKRVLCLESHSKAGGLNSYYKKDGYPFDVGLHSLTNFADPSRSTHRKRPFVKLLRQLRLSYDDWKLCPVSYSMVKFGKEQIRFNNDLNTLRESIASLFPEPSALEGLEKLHEHIQTQLNNFLEEEPFVSAREVLQQDFFPHHPELIEMLLCPVLFYGSARERDIDFHQFMIIYSALFLEGISRPQEGIRPIIQLLLTKIEKEGGEILFKTPARSIQKLEDGSFLITGTKEKSWRALQVISTLGHAETLKQLDWPEKDELEVQEEKFPAGKFSFVEIQLLLKDSSPWGNEGLDCCNLYYNESKTSFDYSCPKGLWRTDNAILSLPHNFGPNHYGQGKQGLIRLTLMANYQEWMSLNSNDYAKAKEQLLEDAIELIEKITGVGITKDNIELADIFTPKTVQKYTRHLGGAVYGGPNKSKDGKTFVPGLYVAGTDQGYLGIVGAMLSGVLVANRYFH